MHILDELQWRGSINQMTDDEGLRDLLDHKSIGVYCGIDPIFLFVLKWGATGVGIANILGYTTT